MSINLTSELDAINSMLAVIGEAPVNRVEDTGLIDAVIARQILNETLRHVQSRGWSWNRDTSVTLVPTFPLPGEILLPANTLSVDASDPSLRIVQRGTRLWNRDTQSFRFTEALRVDITRLLPFEELPQSARHYIMIRASRIFQDRVVGSEKLSGFNAKDETRAWTDLRSEEAKLAGYNLLNSGFAQGILGMRPRSR